MFDNSYDPSASVDHMTLKQLTELNKTDPQKVIDYGKLRCGETIRFFSKDDTAKYNFRSSGYDHILISCIRNGILDHIWLGQFTSKNWEGSLIYSQVLGENHLQRLEYLANKTLITGDSAAYKNYWDGCMYNYAPIIQLF